MKKRVLSPFAALLMAIVSIGATAPRKPGLYAVFDTSMGTFVCELFPGKTPIAVKNFVDLAEGKKEWLTPKGETMKNKPFYNGVIFYRVIKGFMIQAGDITRAGNFTAIVPFQNEIVTTLRFDKPGVLAMANNGPNTNRTQFFVTVSPQPRLNGQFTIFGRVVEGMDVVQRISQVPVVMNMPNKDVVLNRVIIERINK
jgi:peptidyl-prolyl cis-trans isomerase A (cyclophilin A)